MRIAIDSLTDRPIFAADVFHHQASEEFLCPCCGQAVKFVRAGIQQPHFRHRPNVTDEECIEYVGADTSRLSGFLLKDHLENNRLLTIGIATKEVHAGVLAALEWFPFARFRPKEGVRAIRCLDPALPAFPTTPSKIRFIPLEKFQAEYTFRIENEAGPARQLRLSGFNRSRLVFRYTGGFWAVLDPVESMVPGGYLVLSRDDLSLEESPPGIALKFRGSRHEYSLLLLSIAHRVTSGMAEFCQKQFGHVLRQKGFECSVLTDAIALSLGPATWQLTSGYPVNFLLREINASGQRKQLILESACGGARTQQTMDFYGSSGLVQLGTPKPGRHILACSDPEEIIAVFEIRPEESISIPAIQLNIKQKGRTVCFYWATEGLQEALLDVRNELAEIDHLILPFGLQLEVRNPNSRSSLIIDNRQELSQSLRGARLPVELRVVSQGYHVRGFKAISLLPSMSVSSHRICGTECRPPTPRTPFQTALADGARRGAIPRYALLAMRMRS